MARTRIDLHRFRKVYPQFRKSPLLFEGGGTTTLDVEAVVVPFSTSDQETVSLSETYTTPVVVASAVDENVNVWVSSITNDGLGNITITVNTSDVITGEVHVHVVEGTP